MKESLAGRLKGSTFRAAGLDIVLREPCRTNLTASDQAYFTTNHETALVKIVDLSKELSTLKFRHERHMLEALTSCKSVPECSYRDQIEYKKVQYGVFLFVRVRAQPSLREELLCMTAERDILQPIKDILMLLDAMHQRSMAFLNVQPENFVRSASGGYVALNFQRTITKELTFAEARQNCLLWTASESNYRYVAPELISGRSLIGPASDMFNLGCLAYELCYKEYPFGSPLAAINLQYKIPQKTGVMFPVVNELIQRCFVEGPRRPKPFQLLRWLNIKEQQIGDPRDIQQPALPQSSQFTTTIFDQVKNAFTKITKESESWIMSYTEDSEDAPQQRFCIMLLVKIHRNRDKLNKIYQLMMKHTLARLNQPIAMQKMLVLCWNFLRKGPKEVASPSYSCSAKEIIETIGKKYEGQDWLVSELCRLNLSKLDQVVQNMELFDGNFHLIKLSLISRVSVNTMENLQLYLMFLVGSYQKVQQYPFKSSQLGQFVLSSLCDELYDLTAMLIILYVSINKDVEIGKRKDPQDRLSYIQLSLEKALRAIAKFQKMPKLHLISSLQGGVMTYKYAIDFEAMEGINLSTFELFYHSGRIYNNLILPLPFSEAYQRNMKEDFSSYGGPGANRSISSSTFMEEDSDTERPTATNSRDSSSANKRKTSGDSTNAIFENWANPPSTTNQNAKNFDVFAQFKQSHQPATVTHAPSADFEVLWSTRQPDKKHLNFDLFQMNSDSSGQHNTNLSKKQSEARQVPITKSSLKASLVQQPKAPTNAQQPQQQQEKNANVSVVKQTSLGNTTPATTMSNMDLLLFDNLHTTVPEKKQSKQEPKKPTHLFEFDFGLYPKPASQVPAPVIPPVLPPERGSYKQIPAKSSPMQPTSPFPLQVARSSFDPQSSQQQQVASPNSKLINLQFINAPTKKDPLFSIAMQSKSASLLQLQSEICEDMKDNQLRTLIKASNIVVEFNRIDLMKVIGCGSTGEVYKGRYNDQIVAVKKIKVKSHNTTVFKEFERELTTLIRIKKHPNLVSLIAISKKQDDYYLLIDYCQGGNLFELLHRRTQVEVPWKVRITIAKQIAVAMNFLHSSCQPQIIHRDLKSLNILIEGKYNSKDEKINIKVTDFGLSRNPDAEYMTSALGTLHWMAPELLENRNYTLKVDVYSYAVVLWEICSRETPYKDFKSPLAIMKHVTIENGRPNLSRINPGCPAQLRKLMIKCWGGQQQRPSFSEIINQLELIELLY